MSTGSIYISNGYSFYKFIEALSNIKSEILLNFDPMNKLLNISFMDAKRICIINIDIKEFMNTKIEGTVIEEQLGIIIEDFKMILKLKKETKKSIKLIFGDPTKLKVVKRSINFGVVKKSLEYIDSEAIDVSMDGLNTIDYRNSVSINKKLLSDMFNESNNYSDVCEIETNEKGIYFRETGVIGNYEAFYNNKKLKTCNCSQSEINSHSYHYLNVIRNFLDIMENNDIIKIYQKTDHPLKIVIKLERIDTTITYYIACRVKEIEYISEDDLVF